MSVIGSHRRTGIKRKNLHGLNQENNLINPEILTYIQKVQNDNEKVKMLNQTKASAQVERILTNKLINSNGYPNLNEDMTIDKDKKSTAKKGLLYLLNNLSGGTFCPEIEVYFNQMKDIKKTELKHRGKILESNQKNANNNEGGEETGVLKLRNKNEKDSKLKKFRIDKNDDVNNSVLKKNYRKNLVDEDSDDKEEIKKEINKEYGLKKYEKDYDADYLINLYDKNEIKDNTFTINYNKEKLVKMKFQKESQNLE